MNKICILTCLAILLSMLSCKRSGEDSLKQSINNILRKYPEATLSDIYKSFFQDYFGVAHMLASREKVKSYIEYEIGNAVQFDSVLYEPCGKNGNFVRVNLLAVKMGYISADKLTDAFIRSRGASKDSVTEEWRNEWQQILQATKRLVPSLENFSNDSAMIAERLKDGGYVMHHSRRYNERYHPHYRIIHNKIFKEEILPLLP